MIGYVGMCVTAKHRNGCFVHALWRAQAAHRVKATSISAMVLSDGKGKQVVYQNLGLPQLLHPCLHLIIESLQAFTHQVITVHAFHHEVLLSPLSELLPGLSEPPVAIVWLSGELYG